MKLARSLRLGLAGLALTAAVAAAQTSAPAGRAAAPDPRQAAQDALAQRPWRAQFKAVIDEANTLGAAKLDASFGDAWAESEALGEAVRRIGAAQRDGRVAPNGAVFDAIDLGASNLMSRAGCYVALLQRPEFAPQLAALILLRIDGRTPEPVRRGFKAFAQGPCEASQMARSFDPRRAFESGRKLLDAAYSAGSMGALARFLADGDYLKSTAEDPAKAARAAVEADFRRFDSLYDGHAELLRNYSALFADYCPTDPRFCAMRDMLADWRRTDPYCDDVARYVATYYGDPSRNVYLTGPENDGLNRAWEAYHLKFAPACVVIARRTDLLATIRRRLDVVAPLFAVDGKALGDDGVARIRDTVKAAEAGAAGGELDGRIKAYRVASGLDSRVASTSPDPGQAAMASPAPITGLPAMPGEESLRIVGNAASEQQLGLDRLEIREIQERLAAIGGANSINGQMTASTRAAVRSWQGAVGLEPTGFVTRAQLDLLKIRTQDRWRNWRASREAAPEPSAAPHAPPLRREARRRVPRASREPHYGPPRGGAYPPSDIPGAIPAYRVWN